MRRDFVIWAYKRVGLTRTSVYGHGTHCMLFAPKAMLFGIKLRVQWGECAVLDLMEVARQSIITNDRMPLIAMVNTYKVRSYLTACGVNITNLYSNGRKCRYRWLESDRDAAVVARVARLHEKAFVNVLTLTLNEEYRYVVEEHNNRRHVPFALTYKEKAPGDGRAQGGDQGDGGPL